jgi:hypothetical protein
VPSIEPATRASIICGFALSSGVRAVAPGERLCAAHHPVIIPGSAGSVRADAPVDTRVTPGLRKSFPPRAARRAARGGGRRPRGPSGDSREMDRYPAAFV